MDSTDKDPEMQGQSSSYNKLIKQHNRLVDMMAENGRMLLEQSERIESLEGRNLTLIRENSKLNQEVEKLQLELQSSQIREKMLREEMSQTVLLQENEIADLVEIQSAACCEHVESMVPLEHYESLLHLVPFSPPDQRELYEAEKEALILQTKEALDTIDIVLGPNCNSAKHMKQQLIGIKQHVIELQRKLFNKILALEREKKERQKAENNLKEFKLATIPGTPQGQATKSKSSTPAATSLKPKTSAFHRSQNN